MLDTNLLSVKSFTNIFSHAVGCVFILSLASFAVQKPLIRSHFFVFAFISCFKMQIQKNIAVVYIIEFYGFRSYIQVFTSVWVEL